uniref:TIL domain-containing protein n=1 Tax=Anopheles funestus TaxID=62324 RepID=A0A4Y0BP14_ANOFN
MARYVLGVLFLVGSLNIIAAIPTGSPDAEVTHATAEPIHPEAGQPPTTAEPTPSDFTPAEEEPTPPPIVCTDPREIYNDCGSVCDDRTCDNQRRNDIQCSKQCIEGCYCRSGYVRDKTRKCIPAYRCGKSWW